MFELYFSKISEHRLYRLAENVLCHTIESLPAKIRVLIRPVSFFIIKEPDSIGYRDVAPDALGLFEGVSLVDGISLGAEDAPKISLFYMNIWEYSNFHLRLYRKEIRNTIYHEMGHYLGWDEVDLEERGL